MFVNPDKSPGHLTEFNGGKFVDERRWIKGFKWVNMVKLDELNKIKLAELDNNG